MIIRQDERAIRIKNVLLPLLSQVCGETGSRVEENRILFWFSTEENALTGQAAIGDYMGDSGVDFQTVNHGRTVILILLRP